MSEVGRVGLVIGATLDNSYYKTLARSSQSVSQLGSALKEVEKRRLAAKRVLELKTELTALTKKQKNSANGQYTRELSALTTRYVSAQKSAQRYGLSLNKLKAQHAQLGRVAAKTKGRMGLLDRHQGARAGLRGSFRSLLGGAGAAYGVGRFVEAGVSVDKQLLDLRTVLNAEDKQNASVLALAHAREFSRNSAASVSEILNTNYALSSAGLSAEAARFASEISSKVATVTKGDAASVAVVVGDVYNNFKKSLKGSTDEQLTRIGGLLTATQWKFSIANFHQLGEGMKMATAAAVGMKVPLDVTVAAVGQLHNAQLKGSLAGTAFNAILRQMNRASEELGFQIVRDEDGMLDFVETLRGLKRQRYR